VATAADIIAIARPLTDHDADTQVTDPQLVKLLSPRYLALRRKLGRAVPSLFRSTVTWTATAATQDVTAAPLSLTDYDRVYRLRWLNGVAPAGYSPLGVANPIDPEMVPYGRDFVFLERGTTLEFYPSASVIGVGLELSYVTKGAALAATTDAVVLPDGADYILAQLLAADIRVRLEEDPSAHLSIAATEWTDLRWELLQRYGVHPEGMPEEGCG
jgi:hypothetical protein